MSDVLGTIQYYHYLYRKVRRCKSRRRRTTMYTANIQLEGYRKMPSKNVQPKQPKARVIRAKRKREPQVHENAKAALVIKGRKTSQDVNDALKDLVRYDRLSSQHCTFR